MDQACQERLFFALWPGEQVRHDLKQLRQQVSQHVKGKLIPLENLHITLAFIGEVDASLQLCLHRAAQRVQGQSFTLFLNKMDYWKRNQIFWIGAQTLPPAFHALVKDLFTHLQTCGWCSQSYSNQVHITLMRKAHLISQTLPTWNNFSWPVEEFCLVRSQLTPLGSHYEIIARWPLNKK